MLGKKRKLELLALTSQWTQQQKKAFHSLKKAAIDFFSTHARFEQDMSGTARAQIAISEEASLNDKFLKDIKMFESEQMPKDSDFAKADKTLNTLYSQLMKQPDVDQYGAVTKEGIKATQRTWIKYRDAWIKFVEVKYPNHPSNAWKAWLTKQRIAQLNDVVFTN